MFIKPTGFDAFVDHCSRVLHDSYRDRSSSYVPFDQAHPGIQAKTRQDVETVLMAAAERQTCLLLPPAVSA